MSAGGQLVFVFPGQGSQRPGMFGEDARPEVVAAAREAGAALGEDLVALSADAAKLNATVNAQPALLAAGVGAWRAWIASGGGEPAAMAGHSLGEFAALVCAGALEFAAAVALVRARAAAMQAAVPAGAGAMAAVLGLDDAKVATACSAQAQCWVANRNAPGQVVIAGASADVAAAAAACKADGAKRVVELAVSVPAHTPLMAPAQPKLEQALEQAELRLPRIPVLHNATGAAAADLAALRAALVAQLVAPVDWVALVARLGELFGPAPTLVECGPGKVLTGLSRRSAGAGDCASLDDPAARVKLLAR